MSDKQLSTRPWASKTARRITIVLLVGQLVGCAVDMVEPQATLMALFCMATHPENQFLQWAGFAVWLVLGFSWIIGLLALRFAKLRPFYWLLLLFIPIGVLTQNALLTAKIYHCDAP